MNQTGRISALLVAAMFAAGASAQQVVFPAKGQSAQQQKKDEGECHTWAVTNSKYDPTNPPKQAAAPPPPQGATPGSGVRGAARGAVVGEVVQRFLGQILAEPFERLVAGEHLVPVNPALCAVELFDRTVDDVLRGAPDVGTGPVALDVRDDGIVGNDDLLVLVPDASAGNSVRDTVCHSARL